MTDQKKTFLRSGTTAENGAPEMVSKRSEAAAKNVAQVAAE